MGYQKFSRRWRNDTQTLAGLGALAGADREISNRGERTPSTAAPPKVANAPKVGAGNAPSVGGPYARALAALRDRCPLRVEDQCWQQAIEDAERFHAQWSEQAAALGWTARDLFGLHTVPEKPAPTYRRLSRYDETGLIWLLRCRPVVALTDATAAIENPTGALTIYRRHHKPALGPAGDSLHDFR
jgi:hypothetical protein